MNMIEKVARALNPGLFDEDDTRCTCFDCANILNLDRQIALDNAKLAIEAMKEPSEEMLEAANYRILNPGEGMRKHMWQLMITAALKE